MSGEHRPPNARSGLAAVVITTEITSWSDAGQKLSTVVVTPATLSGTDTRGTLSTVVVATEWTSLAFAIGHGAMVNVILQATKQISCDQFGRRNKRDNSDD